LLDGQRKRWPRKPRKPRQKEKRVPNQKQVTDGVIPYDQLPAHVLEEDRQAKLEAGDDGE
jgi:hypothetical protein